MTSIYPPEGIELLFSAFPLAIPLILGGVSALAGAFGNRKNTTTQQQDSSSTTNRDETSTQDVDLSEMPEYTPEMQSILSLLTNTLRNRMLGSTDMSGYTTQGLQKINQGADLKRRAMENILAARGLSYSPAAVTPMGRIESGRIGEQINFLNQIPLLQRQLQGEDIDAFSKFFTSLPVGNRKTGTTTQRTFGTTNTTGQQSGSTTQPGNILGGLFTGLGSGLAMGFGMQNNDSGIKKRTTLNGYDPFPGSR